MKKTRFDIIGEIGRFEPGDIIQHRECPQTGYIKERVDGKYLIGWFRYFGDETEVYKYWSDVESYYVKIGKLDKDSPKVRVTEAERHDIYRSV